MKTRRLMTTVLAALLIAAFSTATDVRAAEGGGKGTSKSSASGKSKSKSSGSDTQSKLGPLAIAKITPDLGQNTLLFEGINFGTNPTVWAGTTGGALNQLVVISSTNIAILATLAETDAASYLAIVQRAEKKGSKSDAIDDAEYTLGIIGPTGPQGEQGIQGFPGPAGADGRPDPPGRSV